ncbi:unnamed protein product [Eruca vesicaria subsp. sativa]|uniref:Uncharacterized protein n=1 Tax=Eruca vesicaria subsp. sativa TaxID=29727 RepID=A0ABC8KBE7_ERUVS|nr:unnamed protein product [Eruca vesicaria subsp. sativa]
MRSYRLRPNSVSETHSKIQIGDVVIVEMMTRMLLGMEQTFKFFVELVKPVVKRVAVPKPKKRDEKPNDVDVIEISSDSDEGHGLVAVQEKKAAAVAKKKTDVSYTSVLTARSKSEWRPNLSAKPVPRKNMLQLQSTQRDHS